MTVNASAITLQLEDILQTQYTSDVYPTFYDSAVCLAENVTYSHRVDHPGALPPPLGCPKPQHLNTPQPAPAARPPSCCFTGARTRTAASGAPCNLHAATALRGSATDAHAAHTARLLASCPPALQAALRTAECPSAPQPSTDQAALPAARRPQTPKPKRSTPRAALTTALTPPSLLKSSQPLNPSTPAGSFTYCSVPLSAPDVFLFASVAVLLAALLANKLSAVWLLISGGAVGVVNYYANLGRVSNAVTLWLHIQVGLWVKSEAGSAPRSHGTLRARA